MAESLLFIGAGAGDKKKPGARQKRTGSATLAIILQFYKLTQVAVGLLLPKPIWKIDLQELINLTT